MKFNKITVALLTVAAHAASGCALADTIIQKVGGDFYIVSNEEAKKLFNQNNFGFFAIAPSSNVIPKRIEPKRVHSAFSKKSAHSKPVINRPVTAIEPAESIFLRMEKKPNEH